MHFSSVEDVLSHSQRRFWALDLRHRRGARSARTDDGAGPDDGMREVWFDLDVAEADGTLDAVASTYSAAAHAIYDGISRPGPRLVTFAPVLKHDVFPLAEILTGLLDKIGRAHV